MYRNRSALTWRCLRPACSGLSTSEHREQDRKADLDPPRAREHDVGADREPEGVIADKRYIDEHANDRKDHQHEREHKPKVHCAYLLALR
jgi:hypothetical protein